MTGAVPGALAAGPLAGDDDELPGLSLGPGDGLRRCDELRDAGGGDALRGRPVVRPRPRPRPRPRALPRTATDRGRQLAHIQPVPETPAASDG